VSFVVSVVEIFCPLFIFYIRNYSAIVIACTVRRHACEGVLVLARSNPYTEVEIASPPKSKSGGSQ
jgi:hypothetical protein